MIFYSTVSLLTYFQVFTALVLQPVWCSSNNVQKYEVTVEACERESGVKRFLKSEWMENAQRFKVSFTGNKEESAASKDILCLPLIIELAPSLSNPTTRKGWPHHRGLRPLLFSNSGVGSFTSHKNQNSESAVRRDLRFFVLTEKTKRSNHLQMSLQRQLFKDPSVGPAGV